MEKFKEESNKFTLVYILCIWVAVVLFILLANSYIIDKNEKELLNSITNITNEINVKLNDEIDEKFNTLRIMARYLSQEEIEDPTKVLSKLNAIVEVHNFNKVGITHPDGTAYLNTGQVVNLGHREYFKQSMTGKNYISNIVESAVSSVAVNVYSVPITEGKEIVGVLWASVLTERFYESVLSDDIYNLDAVYLINSSGETIAQLNTTPLDENFFTFIKETDTINEKSLKEMEEDFENEKQNYKLFKYRNQEVYIYYSKLAYNDWWVLGKISTTKLKNMSNSVRTTSNVISLISIFFISIGFAIAMIKGKKRNDIFKEIAYTDNITKGKNDLFLKSNLNKIINKKDNYAFISLEITNIKSIMNLLGFRNTEILLKSAYHYMSQFLSKDELIVHSYLGEYKIILKYDNMNQLIERIESLDLNRVNKHITSIMGVYLIDSKDMNFEELVLYANIAKENVAIDMKYAVYTEEMHREEINKIKLKEDIKQGIQNKEFKAYFQPKYDRDGKTIVGAEALVRWHKYGTVISPAVFIPICEMQGLIKYIDELVLKDVCKNLKTWISQNKKVVPISVNLSRNYLDKIDCIDRLEEIIHKYDISKDLIAFEVTESSLVGDEEKLKETINSLRHKGFKILLDDFGVGYSSIKTIAEMNFDVLKIDKSFIDGIGDKRWENIMSYTIALSKKLNMNIVAEGIETKEQYEFLLNSNCDVFQGYYFNKPMNSDEFAKLI